MNYKNYAIVAALAVTILATTMGVAYADHEDEYDDNKPMLIFVLLNTGPENHGIIYQNFIFDYDSDTNQHTFTVEGEKGPKVLDLLLLEDEYIPLILVEHPVNQTPEDGPLDLRLDHCDIIENSLYVPRLILTVVVECE